MTITIQPKSGEPRFIHNAFIFNGVIVTGKDGAYSPVFNKALLEDGNKMQDARKSPRVMSNSQIEKWSPFMFSLGENEGGYTVSVFVEEKKTTKKGYNSIFGASSDLGY